MDLRLAARLGTQGQRGRARPTINDRLLPLLMTAESDHDPSQPPMTVQEPARRSGSIVLVLLVAGEIVAAALALMTIGRAQAQPYILGLLALLAMVGLFNLFAFAAGDHGEGHHDHDQSGRHGHHRDHGHAHHRQGSEDSLSSRGILGVGIAAGLLPCPSALVVLLSAIAIHRIGFGFALIAAFSLGLERRSRASASSPSSRGAPSAASRSRVASCARCPPSVRS